MLLPLPSSLSRSPQVLALEAALAYQYPLVSPTSSISEPSGPGLFLGQVYFWDVAYLQIPDGPGVCSKQLVHVSLAVAFVASAAVGLYGMLR
jgi:hypothetical protein